MECLLLLIGRRFGVFGLVSCIVMLQRVNNLIKCLIICLLLLFIVENAKKSIFFSAQQPNARCAKVGGAAYPGSCTEYVSCGANMVPVIKKCPNGLNFHPKLKVCVRPENYPCQNGESSV